MEHLLIFPWTANGLWVAATNALWVLQAVVALGGAAYGYALSATFQLVLPAGYTNRGALLAWGEWLSCHASPGLVSSFKTACYGPGRVRALFALIVAIYISIMPILINLLPNTCIVKENISIPAWGVLERGIEGNLLGLDKMRTIQIRTLAGIGTVNAKTGARVEAGGVVVYAEGRGETKFRAGAASSAYCPARAVSLSTENAACVPDLDQRWDVEAEVHCSNLTDLRNALKTSGNSFDKLVVQSSNQPFDPIQRRHSGSLSLSIAGGPPGVAKCTYNIVISKAVAADNDPGYQLQIAYKLAGRFLPYDQVASGPPTMVGLALSGYLNENQLEDNKASIELSRMMALDVAGSGSQVGGRTYLLLQGGMAADCISNVAMYCLIFSAGIGILWAIAVMIISSFIGGHARSLGHFVWLMSDLKRPIKWCNGYVWRDHLKDPCTWELRIPNGEGELGHIGLRSNAVNEYITETEDKMQSDSVGQLRAINGFRVLRAWRDARLRPHCYGTNL
ncbi:uncharacterized protein VTP21DRAFT_3197 [Calcarisporiella thermophila]|uniref:uncharacterized protein n=1 Tax=Calcarisporiella thermophila TaxID=911321 RepID=UPI003743D2FF